MSKRRQHTSVKISELPNELLEKILACMPIQDSVRTCVLSQKWRNIWKKVPILAFDDNFCTPLIRTSKRKLIEVIYQVLLLHDGPILNFSLKLSNLESCSEIDQFLLVVSKRGIKKFTLDIKKGETYRLPSSFFSCQHELEHLELCYCTFRPPAGFKGFSKLVSLKLDAVSMDGRLLSSLIRNCPLLETLVFLSSTVYDRLKFFAPNLKHLEIEGLWKLLCFENTPKLASVRLDIGFTETSNKYLLSGRLPGVEDLALDFYYAEYMTVNHASKLLVADLCNVKSLCLWYICFRTSTDVSSISTLIRNSSKLEKLVIHAFIDHTKPDSISINGWDFTLHQLKEVEFVDVSGLKCELQFIELLLANSPALEKFVLRPKLEKVADKGLEFFKELSRFQRASPLLKIVYKL